MMFAACTPRPAGLRRHAPLGESLDGARHVHGVPPEAVHFFVTIRSAASATLERAWTDGGGDFLPVVKR
jgi:hypothetical protein